jgi:hypothetical protein
MQLYHTGKEPIIVREFGRNFQKMILFAKDFPEPEKRQAAIERIVDLILEMYPVNYRNVEDYKIKIWSHILQICDYELDVVIPDNVPARKEKVKPERVPYTQGRIRFRHYGKGIERLIDKAVEMDDDERKEELVRVIGAFMKMCYKNWNRDNASDDVVAQEMRTLSRGRINLGEATNINYLIQPQTKVLGANSITNQQKKIGAKQYHKKGGQHQKGQQGGQGGQQGQGGPQGNNNRFKRNPQGGPQGPGGHPGNKNFKKR